MGKMGGARSRKTVAVESRLSDDYYAIVFDSGHCLYFLRLCREK